MQGGLTEPDVVRIFLLFISAADSTAVVESLKHYASLKGFFPMK
jgi:hypothetical protein